MKNNEEMLNKLLKERYFLEGESSWEDICKRVSKIIDDEEEQKKFYQIMHDKKFIPSSPTLMNFDPSGKTCGGLSSCFPLSIGDSIQEIGEALADCMTIVKYSGGVGYNFSKLRSSHEPVRSLNNSKSSGPLSYERMFNVILDEIQQGGRRRGAGMAMYDIDHPDIIDVINSKRDSNDPRYRRFNHSIRVTKEFYDRLENSPNETHLVKWKNGSIRELEDRQGRKITVKQIWDMIIENAWLTGEPGIFNIDNAVAKNTCSRDRETILSNPCSEFAHLENTSCNLGSLNLTKYLCTGENNLDLNLLTLCTDLKTIYLFMDSTIDKNKFPTEKIKRATLATRPIGIGIMGLADCLMKRNVSYGSEECCRFVEKTIKVINRECIRNSIYRAAEKGPCSAVKKDLFLEVYKNYFEKNDVAMDMFNLHSVRNSCFTSIAPTGAISILAEVNGGIEPIFSNYYVRKIEIGKDEKEKIIYREEEFINDILIEHVSKKFNISEKDARKKLEEKLRINPDISSIDFLDENEKSVFRTANEISVEEHLNVLDSANKFCGTSVSKTVNLKNNASKSDVSNVYTEAARRGIIGVTVYRDGCRDNILTSVKNKVESKRFVEMPGVLKFFKSKGVEYFIAISMEDNVPQEIFTSRNYHTEPGRENEIYIPNHETLKGIIKRIKSGSYEFIQDETKKKYVLLGKHSDENVAAFSRMCSLFLRNKGQVSDLIEQLEKIQGDLTCYCKVIMRALKEYIPDGTVSSQECPECKAKMIRKEGCLSCPNCNFTKCG